MQDVITAPTGIPIRQVIQHARTWACNVFAEAYGPTLLMHVPVDDDEDEGESEDAEWSFQTTYIEALPGVKGPGRFFDSSRSTAFLLRKARPGVFDKTILIGRASSNDVCIEHTSISKLHARLRKTDDGTLILSDAGSRNGTRLNDQAIAGERAIRDGDIIALGSRRLRVYGTDKVHALLRSLARK